MFKRVEQPSWPPDLQNHSHPHHHRHHHSHHHRYANSSVVHDGEIIPERGRNCETLANKISEANMTCNMIILSIMGRKKKNRSLELIQEDECYVQDENGEPSDETPYY